MHRVLIKEIRRAVIRVVGELLGRKLSRGEVRQFITAAPVALARESYCRWILDCHHRRDYLMIRLGYHEEAATPACLEEAGRWLGVIGAALRELMRRLGRRHLPVVLIAVPVDKQGLATARPVAGHEIDLRDGR